MLERLFAGIVVIGALLWVASTLATPDAASPLDDEAAILPQAEDEVRVPDAPVEEPPAPAHDGEEDGDDEEEGEGSSDDSDAREEGGRKGKRRPGDA